MKRVGARQTFWKHDTIDEAISENLTDSLIRAEDRNGDLRQVSEDEANLVSSQTDRLGIHMPVIDLDVPCRYVPSSTPGHGHLYIDVEMTEKQMLAILSALADAGVVEKGYLAASRARGMALVRKPGVFKPVVEI